MCFVSIWCVAVVLAILLFLFVAYDFAVVSFCLFDVFGISYSDFGFVIRFL